MAKFVVDTNAKENIVATSWYIEDTSTTMQISRRVLDGHGKNTEIMILENFAIFIAEHPTDDIVYILPESTAIRIITIRSAMKNGGNLATKLLKDWMPNDFQKALIEVAQQIMQILPQYTGKLQIMKARQLYRWELQGAGGAQLQNVPEEITMKGTESSNNGSWTEDGKIGCSENNYLTGTFKVIKKKVGQKEKYYVERTIRVINEDGSTVHMSTVKASAKGLEGTDDSSNRVLNYLTLRTKTAEALPRVIRKTQVTVVDA